MALRNPANEKDEQDTSAQLGEKSVIYNARNEVDWINPAYMPDSTDHWNIASVIGGSDDASKGMAGDAPWNNLHVRPIPFWKDYGRTIAQPQPVKGYPGVFTLKNLSDMGVTSSAYSISTEMTIGYGDVANMLHFANGALLFGATSESNYYAATIDNLSGYYTSGTANPTLKVTKGPDTLLNAGLSAVITKDNYTKPHTLTLTVVDNTKAELYVDDHYIGSISTDLTNLNTYFGVNRAGFSYGGTTYNTGSTLIHNVTVKDNNGFNYINTFETEGEESDFPSAKFSNNSMITTGAVFYGTSKYFGQRWQIRLPYNAQIVPYLKLGSNTPADQPIEIKTETYAQSQQRITYITREGAQEFEGLSWINGDYLYFDIPNNVNIAELGYRETGYDVTAGKNSDFEGYFDSVIDMDDASYNLFTGGHTWDQPQTNIDNNFYDELWKKAIRTVYVTIRDNYMDCPDRERSQYIGDAVNEMEEGYYSLGTGLNDLTAKAIRNICDWQQEITIDGRTYYIMSNVRPGGNSQEISMQSLGTAHAALNHYLFAGDINLIRDTYQPLYNYLTNYDIEDTGEYNGLICIRPQSKHGFISAFPHYDWSDWGNNMDTLIATNLWWYLSAKSIRQMADLDGVASTAEQIKWLDERLQSIENNFEKFWNDDLNGYATNWAIGDWRSKSAVGNGSHLVDDRVNALAVVAGLVPKSKYHYVRDLFMGTDSSPAYENASIYMEKYILEALYQMGYPEDAMYRMMKRHMSDVNDKTSSTLPEHFGMGGTKNHGWSGGGMLALSRYAAGIEPTKPGYKDWHVIPQLGGFTAIDTRVPSEIGNIDFSIQTDKANHSLSMTVVSPGGNAELWVPVMENKLIVNTSNNAAFVGNKTKYGKQYAVFKATSAGTFQFATEPYSFTLSDPSITEYTADSNFDVLVSVPSDCENVKIVNEAGVAIGKKAQTIIKNNGGTKLYKITLAVGTPGERTLSAMVMGQVGDYKDVGAMLDVKIIPPAPLPAEDIVSAASVSSSGVNTPFTVTMVTSASVNKVKIVGETGSSIGTLSSSVVTSGNTKVWTISIKVGTKGNRTLTALGAVALGGYGTEGKTFNIAVV